MRNFSFKTRLVYFGGITLASLVFFAMQLYAVTSSETGAGSMVLLILWGLMVVFGIGGIIYSISKKDRHSK